MFAIRLMLWLAFVEIVAGDRILCQRLGFDRERLRWGRLLAGHVAFRHRALLDVEDRLAGDAIERKHQSGLVDDDHGGHQLSVAAQVDEKRRRLGVIVPDVMMHELKVPEILASVRIDRDDRGREQIVAGAVDADAVVVRGAERHIKDAALRIERRITPDIDAGSVCGAVPAPGVIAELPRPRHGVERPHQLAGPGVPGARIARGPGSAIGPTRPFAGARTRDDEILVDGRRRQQRVGRIRAGLHDLRRLERNDAILTKPLIERAVGSLQ